MIWKLKRSKWIWVPPFLVVIVLSVSCINKVYSYMDKYMSSVSDSSYSHLDLKNSAKLVSNGNAIKKPIKESLRGWTGSVLLSSVYDNDRSIMDTWKPINVIPKILHISWKTSEVPKFAYNNIKQWQKLHPDWEIIFWSDDDVYRFINIALHKSDTLTKFQNLPKTIMKMDFFRYVLLYTIGGVYADMDVTPLRSIDPVISHHSCIVSREPEPFPNTLSIDGTILASNFFIAAKPGHPFMRFLMNNIVLRLRNGGKPEAGPLAVTYALKDYYNEIPVSGRDGAVYLAPSIYFDPPHGDGDKVHMDMLNHRCSMLGAHSGSKYLKLLCKTLAEKRRINFDAMLKHPKYFKDSFVFHKMFGSWFSNSAEKQTIISLSTLPFKVIQPSHIFQLHKDLTPYEREHKVLNLQYDPE